MSGEARAVERSTGLPVTLRSLSADLATLGVRPGMVLIVHSSLSALGWVCGGAVTVILALEGLLGPEGTLVMPAHSTGLTDPAGWQHPPVPESWWQLIRETTPAYEPDLTPTRGIGVIAESFRKQRGVLRSGHPVLSFCAWGAQAAAVVAGHTLENPMGEGSPLARVYDLDGWVLLLGAGHENNTSLHLAEYRAAYPGRRVASCGTAMNVDGRAQWIWYDDINGDSDDFGKIGADFGRETGRERVGRVGYGTARLMPQRALVDYGVRWMERNRTGAADQVGGQR